MIRSLIEALDTELDKHAPHSCTAECAEDMWAAFANALGAFDRWAKGLDAHGGPVARTTPVCPTCRCWENSVCSDGFHAPKFAALVARVGPLPQTQLATAGEPPAFAFPFVVPETKGDK